MNRDDLIKYMLVRPFPSIPPEYASSGISALYNGLLVALRIEADAVHWIDNDIYWLWQGGTIRHDKLNHPELGQSIRKLVRVALKFDKTIQEHVEILKDSENEILLRLRYDLID